MILHSLFPQPVAFFPLERDFSQEEMDCLLNQEKKGNVGNTTSVESYILNQPALSVLKEFVESSLNKYLSGIHAPKDGVGLRITQSWVNYTEPGQFHHKHAHPNSFISGVLYIKANKELDKIHFYRDGFQQLKLPVKDWNVYNSESWWLSVDACQLIVFPSHLTHNVETVKGDTTRISLSFNTFPVGHLGDESQLTGLQLGN